MKAATPIFQTQKIVWMWIILIAVLTSLVINGALNQRGAQAMINCAMRFSQPVSQENSCELRVEAGAAEMTVLARTSLLSGELNWTLHDPSGTLVWQSNSTAGESEQTYRSSRPTPGTWLLTVRAEAAQGTYNFQ